MNTSVINFEPFTLVYALFTINNKITEPIYLVHIAHVLFASSIIRFRRESLIQDQCKLCKRKFKKHKLHLTAHQIEIRKLNSLRATLLRLFSFLMWRKDDIEN